VVPRKNEPDLDDVPETVLADLHVHLVDDVNEVFEVALAA
jgi:ATP-dependent Lon protease